MVSTRATVLERRSDLPLCSVRRIRQIRADKRTSSRGRFNDNPGAYGGFCEMHEVLTSKKLQQAEREVRSLLAIPVKIGRDMPREDQILLGKAIVGRPGKDDHWVISDTSGCTFTAATSENPEEGARPVRLHRLRQAHAEAAGDGAFVGGGSRVCVGLTDYRAYMASVSPGRSRGRTLSNRTPQRTLVQVPTPTPRVRPATVAGCTSQKHQQHLRQPRHSSMLDTKKASAAVGGLLSDWGEEVDAEGDVQRGIKTKSTIVVPIPQEGGRTTTWLYGQDHRGHGEQGGHFAGGENGAKKSAPVTARKHADKGFITQQHSSSRAHDVRSGKAHNKPFLAGGRCQRETTIGRVGRPITTTTPGAGDGEHPCPARIRPHDNSTSKPSQTLCNTTATTSTLKKASPPTQSGKIDVLRAQEGIHFNGVRGGSLHPQPLFSSYYLGVGEAGDGGEGGQKKRGGTPSLHRALVITDGMREELLNPMSHRFKILRGAH